MFGAAETPMITGATLMLRIIYDATAAWLIDRRKHGVGHAVRI